jgi:hypothetical protein
VVSGARGVATGVRNGASNGSHSTAVAALTLGAIGAAGLVEWPILVAVGGTALVVHQLANQRNDKPSTSTRAAPAVSSGSSSSAPKPPAKRAPVKKAAIKKGPAKRSPARKSNSRLHRPEVLSQVLLSARTPIYCPTWGGQDAPEGISERLGTVAVGQMD